MAKTKKQYRCFICKKISTDFHHIFPGSKRKLSDTYSIKVPICSPTPGHTYGGMSRCHALCHRILCDTKENQLIRYQRTACKFLGISYTETFRALNQSDYKKLEKIMIKCLKVLAENEVK